MKGKHLLHRKGKLFPVRAVRKTAFNIRLSLLDMYTIHYACAYSGDHDQTPRFAASDLGLHCLPMSHKKDAMLIWVKVRDYSNDTYTLCLEQNSYFPRYRRIHKSRVPSEQTLF